MKHLIDFESAAEAEKRRFQSMQGQQQAKHQVFMEITGTITTTWCPGQQQHPQSPHWIYLVPVGSPTGSAWPIHYSPVPQQSMSPVAQKTDVCPSIKVSTILDNALNMKRLQNQQMSQVQPTCVIKTLTSR